MRKQIFRKLLFLFIGLLSAGLFLFGGSKASAISPTTINFQGKVVNNTTGNVGINISDSSYTVIFRLYNTQSPTTTGSCTLVNNCLWEESDTVSTTNGVFQVELGANCSFFSAASCNNSTPVDFSSNSLYLTMKFNSDSAGFMSPTIHFTGIPYAYSATNSSQLGGISASNYVQLATGNLQADNSTSNSIAINKTGASGDIMLLEANSKKALEVSNSGTLLLGQAGASGLDGTLTFNNHAGSHTVSFSLQADPGASYTLLLPTTGPSTSQCLQTDGTTANQLVFSACATGGSGVTTVGTFSGSSQVNGASISGSTITFGPADATNPGMVSTGNQTFVGDKTIKSTSNSLTAFQIQNSSAASLFNADASNMRIGVNVSYTSMTVPSGLTSVASSGTGFTAGQSYLYEVTAIDSAGGETTVSNEPTACAPATTNLQCTLAWTAVTGASGYKVYRTANGGASGSEKYLTTVLTNSYIDTNTITLSSTAAPGSNTAYTSTNNSSSLLQLSVGGLGTPAGQIYASGVVPTTYTGISGSGLSGQTAVYVQGRYAYVTSSTNNSLVIFDISNPSAPVNVGSTTSGLSSPGTIYVQGHYAYVANFSSLVIFDVTNPASPTNVGSTSGGLNGALKIYVQGRYAYVTNSNSKSLVIFDISNPAVPNIVGSIAGLNAPQGLYVQGRYAYVTNVGNSSLAILDVSNPAAPTSVGSTTTGLSSPRSVYVQGRYAYVTSSSNNSLVVFDVSNPAAPVNISSILIGGAAPRDVYVQGRYAYIVGNSGNILVVLDISNPAAPVNLGSTTSGLSSPVSVYVQGRYAYVGSTAKIVIYDLGGEYAQQLESGGAEVGTLQVDTNGQVAGDFNVQGGLQVGQSIQAAGNLGVYGGAYVQGSTILGGGSNLLGPPSGTPSVGFTGTPGGSAVTWSYVVTAVNAYGGESTASATGSNFAPGSSNSTLSSSNHNDISWSAVTGATAYKIYRTGATGGTPSTTGYIGTTTSTSFSDTGIGGAGNSSPTTDTTGQLTVMGSALFKNSSNSASALQVQNASGSSILNVDTSTTTITFGSATNGLVLTASTYEPVLNGTARHTMRIGLTPEYAGATMTGTGTGTMTSDNETSSPFHNYYKWTTTQGTSQTYSVWVRVALPLNFSAWCSTTNCNPTIFLYTKNSGSSASSVQIATFDTANATVQALTNIASANATWNENSVNASPSAQTWTAGGYMTLQIQMSAISSSTTQIGELRMDYLSKY